MTETGKVIKVISKGLGRNSAELQIVFKVGNSDISTRVGYPTPHDIPAYLSHVTVATHALAIGTEVEFATKTACDKTEELVYLVLK